MTETKHEFNLTMTLFCIVLTGIIAVMAVYLLDEIKTKDYCQNGLMSYNLSLDAKKNMIEPPPFMIKMDEIHEKYNYTEDFRCYNFSMALANELAEMGYKAKVVEGMVFEREYCQERDMEANGDGQVFYKVIEEKECAEAHAWVEVVVSIDATTGELISPYEIK
jgi:hypothetical protein